MQENNMSGTLQRLTPYQFRILGVSDSKDESLARPRVGYWKDAWRRLKENKIAVMALFLLIILGFMVIFGPKISGYHYAYLDNRVVNQGPSAAHWFGTDSLGRDLFARVWQGGRVSMIIGVLAAVIGTLVGAVSQDWLGVRCCN